MGPIAHPAFARGVPWFACGLACGLGLALPTARLNGLGLFSLDFVALTIHFGVAYGVSFGLLGLGVAALTGHLRARAAPVAWAVEAAGAVGLSALVIFRTEFLQEFPVRLPWLEAAAAGGLAAGLALRARLAWQRGLVPPMLALGLALVPLPRAYWPAALEPPPQPPGALPERGTGGGPVLLVGIDSFDPRRAEQRIADGTLPALAALASQGAIGRTRTLVPTQSPVVWTTIATGAWPQAHGIREFTERPLPFVRRPLQLVPLHVGLGRYLQGLEALGPWGLRPVSDLGRQRAGLWDAATAYHLDSLVVGWWPSWPAPAVRGRVVSNLFRTDSGGGTRSAALTYPRELAARIATMAVPRAVAERERLARLTDRLGPPARPASWACLAAITDDETRAAAALELLAEARPDLALVYFRGTDPLSHLGSSWEKAGLRLDDETRQELLELRDSYESAVDGWLSLLVAALAPETVVVTSDHGFEWAAPAVGGHEHGPPGFLLLSGRGAPRGRLGPTVSVFDIAPTVLATLGLPAARDMPGHSLTTLEVHSSIASYGPPGVRPKLQTAPDPKAIEDLRALGYLSGR